MDTIKINGGSFKLSAVVAYKTEAAFVKHYNNLLSGWLTDEQRKATLKEVFRIARILKRQEDANSNGNVKPDSNPRHPADCENKPWRNPGTDPGLEPGSVNAGQTL